MDAGKRLELSGTAPGPFSLALAHGDVRVTGEVVVADGRFRAMVPLEHDPWGFGPAPLPPGTWHLEWSDDRDGGQLPIPDALAAATPLDLHPGSLQVRVLRGLRGQLLVQLAPPLADDERGPWAQHRLLAEYAASTAPLDHGLALFSSYAGSGATDSPRAIFEELQRRRPEVRVLWGVAHDGIRVPEGPRRCWCAAGPGSPHWRRPAWS